VMTPTDATADLTAPESYSSFWDAIPVDSGGSEPTPHVVRAAAEDGRAVSLWVEQSDVGLN